MPESKTGGTVVVPPTTTTGWALLDGRFTYVDPDVALAVFLMDAASEGKPAPMIATPVASWLCTTALAEAITNAALPHVDRTPEQAQARIAHGAQLFHEQTGARIRLDDATAQAAQWLIRKYCTDSPTRRPGKDGRRKHRARLAADAIVAAVA